jgi:hypothetical protein
MNVCFWCKRGISGEGDPEYINYDYCPVCQDKVDQGITTIQVTTEPNDNPPIKDALYPTGKWAVLREEFVKKSLSDWAGLDDVLKTRHMFVNEETWKNLNLPD